jgi:hypothetical protein
VKQETTKVTLRLSSGFQDFLQHTGGGSSPS